MSEPSKFEIPQEELDPVQNQGEYAMSAAIATANFMKYVESAIEQVLPTVAQEIDTDYYNSRLVDFLMLSSRIAREAMSPTAIMVHCPTVTEVRQEEVGDLHFRLICTVKRKTRLNRTRKYIERYVYFHKIPGYQVDVEVKYAQGGRIGMDADKEFKRIMSEHGKDKCPNCGKEIDRGDVAWNNRSTDAGTDYATGEIQCSACDTEIANGSSWYPGADDFEEFVENLLEDILDGR